MKNVFMPAGGKGLGTELLEQLRVFGITVREIENVADAERLCSSLGAGLILVDAECIDRDPVLVAEIGRLKEGLGTAIKVIYYGDEDDFGSRLRALRAGGEAFFQLPVDAGRLVRRIDSSFNEAEPYRVLIVDDDPLQLEYCGAILGKAGMSVSSTTDATKVIPLIVETQPDILLVDMYMPQCTGSELAGVLRQYEAFGALPIVFLSAERDSEKQIAAIRREGYDFLEKPVRPEQLVGSIAALADRRRAMRQYLARDYLTGVFNHAFLMEKLVNEVLRARRFGSVLSFAKINIDGLKLANERFGHQSGDRVLRSLALLLAGRLRSTDSLGRFNGQDFGIILPGTNGASAAKLLDEQRQIFGRIVHRFQDTSPSLTFCAGIASYPDFVGVKDLGDAADRALKKAKDCGRDTVVVESSSG
jgi:diguanylate cyclase (GGDEF)-like protein